MERERGKFLFRRRGLPEWSARTRYNRIAITCVGPYVRCKVHICILYKLYYIMQHITRVCCDKMLMKFSGPVEPRSPAHRIVYYYVQKRDASGNKI